MENEQQSDKINSFQSIITLNVSGLILFSKTEPTAIRIVQE